MATCTDEIYHKLVAEMATDVRYTTRSEERRVGKSV